MSILGGCAVCTLGGETGTSGRILFGPEGDIWTLCWKLVEYVPSSFSMILGCTEGRGLVISGRTFWGTMAYFSLFLVSEGLLFSANYLPPLKISGRISLLRPFGSCRCWKMAHGVHNDIFWGKIVGEWSIVWEKFNAIWFSLSSCFGDIYTMAPIMVHWGTNIPYFYSMWCPSSSLSWFFMNNHLCFRRG